MGYAVQRTFDLESCVPAAELPGGAPDRGTALAALVNFLIGEPNATAGLDFPFSLPAEFISNRTWAGFIAAFAANYPSAEAFRDDCRRQTNGREVKRRTDVESRVPFCVYNLRLYRQTHAGIVDVLLPLVRSGAARIVPMQSPENGMITIAEICPASLLKAEGLYAPYKGHGTEPRDARRGLLAKLIRRGLLAPPHPALHKRIIKDVGGDALDAVLAAIAAGRLPPHLGKPDRLDRIEGRVYF